MINAISRSICIKNVCIESVYDVGNYIKNAGVNNIYGLTHKSRTYSIWC